MSFQSFILEHWAIALVALVILFEASRVIYRLTFHPLSRFPGPKLAAATHFYAIYYDMFLPGQFVKHIAQLHKRPGSPNLAGRTPREGSGYVLQVPTFSLKELLSERKGKHAEGRRLARIHKVGSNFTKDPEFYANPMIGLSLLCTVDPTEAKKRKDAFHPFFSKTAVRRVEFLCHAKVSQFLNILEEAASNSTVVDMYRGFGCLTADVILDYSYQRDFSALSTKDFKSGIVDAFTDLTTTAQFGTYFRRCYAVGDWVANQLPKGILAWVSPPMLTVVEFKEVNFAQT
ncbi:MAG: hypothetical protein M1813_009799, partial [Trichoglossum hirsutum]